MLGLFRMTEAIRAPILFVNLTEVPRWYLANTPNDKPRQAHHITSQAKPNTDHSTASLMRLMQVDRVTNQFPRLLGGAANSAAIVFTLGHGSIIVFVFNWTNCQGFEAGVRNTNLRKSLPSLVSVNSRECLCKWQSALVFTKRNLAALVCATRSKVYQYMVKEAVTLHPHWR